MATLQQAQSALEIRNLNLPERPHVEDIEVTDYVDTSGEGALLIQVILSDDTKDEDITGDAIIGIKSAIRDALLDKGIHEFPYVVFAKRSELESPDIVE